MDELKQWKIPSARLQLAAEDSEIEKGVFRIEDNGLGQWQQAITYFVKSLFIRKHKIKCEMKPETIMIKVENSLSGNNYRESTTPLPVHDSDEESDSALRLSHTLHQLGIVHENLADYREAMICYEEAWFIRKLHLTRDHVIMAQSLCRIGNLKLLIVKTTL